MICPENKCTGCGACYSVCSQNCISMQADSVGTIRPAIDESKCVHCNLCKSVCHNNNEYNFKQPHKSYAFRTTDEVLYKKAASGGAATEFYLYALKNDFFCMGTKFTKNGVFFAPILVEDDLNWACSSKYSFSDMFTENVFKCYESALKDGKKTLFVGLPCQTAALRSYLKLKKVDLDRIVFVDLICHGTPNFDYLKQHLESIETRFARKVEILSFRDKTKDYHLKCISSGNPFYEKNMLGAETYGNAFLSNLIFRENCYSCNFARSQRQSDITIGDYDGLGTHFKYEHKNNPVSLVLVNTEKGSKFFGKVLPSDSDIFCEERPIEEPFMNEINGQLHHPSVPNKKRAAFLKCFEKTKNFDFSVKKSLGLELYAYYYRFDYNKNRIKQLIKRLIRYEGKKC